MVLTLGMTAVVAFQVVKVDGWKGYAATGGLVVAVLAAVWTGTEVVP